MVSVWIQIASNTSRQISLTASLSSFEAVSRLLVFVELVAQASIWEKFNSAVNVNVQVDLTGQMDFRCKCSATEDAPSHKPSTQDKSRHLSEVTSPFLNFTSLKSYDVILRTFCYDVALCVVCKRKK